MDMLTMLVSLLFFANSPMPSRRLYQPRGVFPTSPDSQRGRTDDEFLQVYDVWTGVEGELRTNNMRKISCSLEREGQNGLAERKDTSSDKG